MTPLQELFGDEEVCAKIRRKLPFLFALAEQQASRAGRVGMEVGTLREQILVALLIYKFGEDSVNLGPITEPEIDVWVKGSPLSIKTVTTKSIKSMGIPAVKVIWTVDWERVKKFAEDYRPKCDMLLAIVRWNGEGGLYGIPLEAQEEVFESLGRERYLRLPKRGTNPRGVEISPNAMKALIEHPRTQALLIEWRRPTDLEAKEGRLAPYKRWLHYWQSD